MDKPPVKVCEAKEYLNVLDPARYRPISDDVYLLFVHLYFFWTKDIA